METHDDRQQKDEVPRDGQERKRRFRIVKLEERIAPGANNTHGAVCNSQAGHCLPSYRTCGTGCFTR